ncbi:hypothetical protein [Hydrogenothermus marinus]|uniref:Uncharacterized protein n=1 Tax=Hydrogenothermus marinus TaxID=133270 RepID=A0A3M0BST5_9AQUI|nr:hypothetical protein [Hydrogenothermus marinus]RMA97575.1 hypothetical protein CLV39_0192 [Hydrogenothermus marinus]
MGVLKDIETALSVDEKVQKIFSYLAEKDIKEINEFFYFYKIRGSIEKGVLEIKMYFQFENKWRDIAKVDLEKDEFIEHIDKKLFKTLLYKENRYIIEYADRELKRISNVILSLIALILGILVALIISQILS